MGEDLYDGLRERYPGVACRIYAPVGAHENLLAYLVRRLLENGANSSFVSRLGDRAVPASELLTRPHSIVGSSNRARAAALALPLDIHAPSRKLASGVEFGEAQALDALVASLAGTAEARQAAAIVAGARGRKGKAPQPQRGDRKIISPIDGADSSRRRRRRRASRSRRGDAEGEDGLWRVVPRAGRAPR